MKSNNKNYTLFLFLIKRLIKINIYKTSNQNLVRENDHPIKIKCFL